MSRVEEIREHLKVVADYDKDGWGPDLAVRQVRILMELGQELLAEIGRLEEEEKRREVFFSAVVAYCESVKRLWPDRAAHAEQRGMADMILSIVTCKGEPRDSVHFMTVFDILCQRRLHQIHEDMKAVEAENQRLRAAAGPFVDFHNRFVVPAKEKMGKHCSSTAKVAVFGGRDSIYWADILFDSWFALAEAVNPGDKETK